MDKQLRLFDSGGAACEQAVQGSLPLLHPPYSVLSVSGRRAASRYYVHSAALTLDHF